MTSASDLNFSTKSLYSDFDYLKYSFEKSEKKESKHRDFLTSNETFLSSNLSKKAHKNLREIEAIALQMSQETPPEESKQILSFAYSQQTEAISTAKAAAKELAKAKHKLKKAQKYSHDQDNRLSKVSQEVFKKFKPSKMLAKDSRLSEKFSKGKFKRHEKSITRANKAQEDALTGQQNAKSQEELARSKVLKAEQIASETSNIVNSITEQIDLVAKRITENKNSEKKRK